MNAPGPFESNDTTEPVSQTLEKMVDHYRESSRISLDDMLHGLRHRGFAVLMLVLVLPNCVPVPIPPGGSTLFSIPLLFIAVQMLFGKHSPWMPKWLRAKSLEQKTIDKIVRIAAPRLRWVEKFLHVRWNFTASKNGERFIGFIWLLFAISIAVPLPMTNFLPGVGTLVMALGMLGRDGVVVIVGILIGILGVVFTSLLLTLGVEVITQFLPFLANKI